MRFKNVFDLFSSDNFDLILFGGLIIFLLFVVPNLGFKKEGGYEGWSVSNYLGFAW